MMLASFRAWSQSLLAKILLGVLVLAFGVWGVSGVAGGAFEAALRLTGFGPKDLAKVGSVTINGDDYAKTLQRETQQASQMAQKPITLDEARKMGLNKQVLDAMVAQAAVTSKAQDLGLVVSQKQILQELAADRRFQDKTGRLDPVAFQRALQSSGLTQAQYFAQQTKMRTEAAILDTASNKLEMPQAFATALAQYQGETRDVKYFDVTATEADIQKPVDADLQAQYQKTPAAYTAPEYRTAAVMAVDAKSLAASQVATDDEIKAAFDTHGKDYATPDKRTIIQLTFPDMDAATKAKARIAGGEDILKIASDMGKAEKDITLTDKVRDDFLDPAIGDAAFKLKEGEVSDPVKGGLAIALLKAVKVAPAHQPALDEIKTQLADSVKLTKARAKLQDIYAAVEDARGKSEKFEQIAQEQSLNLTLLPLVSESGKNQDGKDLTAMVSPEVIKAIFASDVGLETDALGGKDAYTWYEVRSVVPSAIKPLDQVKAQVEGDVVHARIRQAAIDKANAIATAIKGGKAIDAAAAEASATVQTAQGLKRNQQTDAFDGASLAAAFSVPEQGTATAPLGDGKSARVMQVAKITLPTLGAANPELDQAKKQLGAEFGNGLQQALVAALKKNAGVKLNVDLWKQNNAGEEPPSE